MEQFTPEEQERLEKSRLKNDEALVREGATMTIDKGGKSHMHLTREQETDAIVEMRLDELHKRESKVTERIDDKFEIGETRVFTANQIIDAIAGFEKLDPKDLFITESISTPYKEITNATVKLKDEISFPRFGFSVCYIFEIKGRSAESDPDPVSVEVTHIGKLLQSADSDESIIRKEIEMEYAKSEEERQNAIEDRITGDDGTIAEKFIEYNGFKWVKAGERREEDEGEEWKK